MKWIIKHVWKSPISIGCYINIDNKENNTAVWSSTRPQLVKRYEGSSPKMAISQSVRSSCEIGSTLGILTVFLKTGFIFFGQQATNSFQSCSNLFKHKETYVFQSCLYSIQNRDPSSWRRNMASIASVIPFFLGWCFQVPGESMMKAHRWSADEWWSSFAVGVCLEMMGCCWNSVWWLVSQELWWFMSHMYIYIYTCHMSFCCKHHFGMIRKSSERLISEYDLGKMLPQFMVLATQGSAVLAHPQVYTYTYYAYVII